VVKVAHHPRSRLHDGILWTRVADTPEGRARVDAEIARLRVWCERQGIPWSRTTTQARQGSTRRPASREFRF